MEQISTWILPLLRVLRVVKALPQLQVTSVTKYSGWMPLFKALSFLDAAGSPGDGSPAEVNRRLNQPWIVPDQGL